TITESVPGRKVGIRLEFITYHSTNATAFTLAPEGDATRVTWSMDGTNNFVSKAMSIFMSMDAMIGPDFARGLATLKSVAEGAAGEPAGTAPDSAAAPKAA